MGRHAFSVVAGVVAAVALISIIWAAARSGPPPSRGTSTQGTPGPEPDERAHWPDAKPEEAVRERDETLTEVVEQKELPAEDRPEAAPERPGRVNGVVRTARRTMTPAGSVWAFGSNERGQLGTGTVPDRSTPFLARGPTGVRQVSAGWHHSLALANDGSVWTWGKKCYVRPEDGEPESSRVPVKVEGLPQIVAVSAGVHHSLALAADGTVWEWSAGGSEMVHRGDRDRPAPRHFGPERIEGVRGVKAIAGGSSFSLALREDGTVWIWRGQKQRERLRARGELGDEPMRVTGLPSIRTIACGRRRGFALTAEGKVFEWKVDSWRKLVRSMSSPFSEAVMVAVGGQHTVALKKDGTVWIWGNNPYARPGEGLIGDGRSPVRVEGLSDVSFVAANSWHSLALKADGTVWGWGLNKHGQLGNGTKRRCQLDPVQVVRVRGATAIAAGLWHSLVVVGGESPNHPPEARDVSVPTAEGTPVRVPLAGSDPEGVSPSYEVLQGPSHGTLSGEGGARTYTPEPGFVGSDSFTYRARDGETASDPASATIAVLADARTGRIWAWGRNARGQLGDGTAEDGYVPVPVVGLGGVISIACAGGHCLALRSDGTVWAWGGNEHGQLGDESGEDSRAPVRVKRLTDVKAISAGGRHSLALKADGTVWGWGLNAHGQLGDGMTIDRDSPVQVSGLMNVAAIAAGGSSYAVKENGTVWAWGWNGGGILGDGTWEERHTPVRVKTLERVKAIAAAGGHVHALLEDGTVWSWGYKRMIGDGADKQRSTPVQVPGLADIVDVQAGSTFCLALQRDGTLWAWGDNPDAQAGRNRPEQVWGLDGVKSISVGNRHALALTQDGVVLAWGLGRAGQLGDGNARGSRMPVVVTGLGRAKAIAAGGRHSLALVEEQELFVPEDAETF